MGGLVGGCPSFGCHQAVVARSAWQVNGNTIHRLATHLGLPGTGLSTGRGGGRVRWLQLGLLRRPAAGARRRRWLLAAPGSPAPGLRFQVSRSVALQGG